MIENANEAVIFGDTMTETGKGGKGGKKLTNKKDLNMTLGGRKGGGRREEGREGKGGKKEGELTRWRREQECQ